MRLTGKVAVVTGAARGIGKVIARHLAEEGATVTLSDRNCEQGEATAGEFAAQGLKCSFLPADIAAPQESRNLIEKTVGTFGRIDILVNNAGVDPAVPFLDVSEEMWETVLGTNLRGTFFCAQAAARAMRSPGRGRIINISSIHAEHSMPGFSAYAASKGGINSLTRQLALDLSPYSITVNAVAPGAIEVEKFVADPLYDRAALAKEIPMGRVGFARDVSALVVFLASDEAGWITGKVLTVDGGTSSRLYLYAGRPIPAGVPRGTEESR